jgi:acyl carrier protein
MTPPEEEHMPPFDSDAILDAVRDELRKALAFGDDQVNPDDQLDMLPNADSIRLMRTVSALERRFDVELDDDEIRNALTVADLVRVVGDATATSPRG